MALPDWLDPLYDPEEMGAADSFAMEERGIFELELAEKAGAGLAAAVAEVVAGGPVRVVVGAGNNGGDGLIAARLLREAGHDVDVLTALPLEDLEGVPRTNLDRLTGPGPRPFASAELEGSGAVVDALLGTGFTGAVRAPLDDVIAAINAQPAPVVAADVPSGVNAATGEVAGQAVRAQLTATNHGPKIGLYVAPGAEYAGTVRVVDIGIPRGSPAVALAGLITPRVLAQVGSRTRYGSKFDSGVVVIAGGAQGLTGAPTMAALAAMRSGAGYVQVAVPASAEPAVEQRLLEAMTRGLPEADGGHVEAGAEVVAELAQRAGAVVLGPGLGRSAGAIAFARAVARMVEAPLVVDADGLFAHASAEALEELAKRPGPTVLTPHAGELARLLETDSDDIGAHRLASARAAAERSGAVVVVKGDDTIVAAPGGPVAVSPGATPALATAGTGDVLSGLTGTLLAKGLDAFAAAAAAVLAHAEAGRVAAARVGADYTVASDVIEALPAALTTLRRGRTS